MTYGKTMTLALMALLGACQDKAPSTPTNSANATAQALPHSQHESKTMSTSIQDAAHTSGKYVALSKQCGDVALHLQCDSDNGTQESPRDCKQTSLRLTALEGRSFDIPKPKELVDYTAVGIGCATSSRNDKPYFVVQYGELPYGCGFCEWYYLYDHEGKQLTHSNPLILSDATLPNGRNQFPNNQEFDALSKDIGLNKADIELMECDADVDASGNLACLKENMHGDR